MIEDDDPIAKSLNIVSKYDATADDKSLPDYKDATELEADGDMKYVRSNLYELIEISKEAAGNLANIADQSQDHQSYSALASMLKAGAALNKSLVDLQAKRPPKINDNNVINNNLIITTEQLQKMISDQMKR